MHFHNFVVLHKTMFLSTWWCGGGGGGLVTKLCPALATPLTAACRAPLSMGFPRQEYWTELPFLSSGDLPDPESEPILLHCRWILYCWATREAVLSTGFGLFKTMAQWLTYIICRISLHAQCQFCPCRWPVIGSKILLYVCSDLWQIIICLQFILQMLIFLELYKIYPFIISELLFPKPAS